jgi:transcriptional regulator with XRE-family HTH domain
MKRGPVPVALTNFGERLIALCDARGITLRDLGGMAGYAGDPSSRMSQLLKTERPTLAVVQRLAEALGVDRSELDPDLVPQRKI